MNKIAIQKVCKNDNWTDFEWFIDGVRLSEHLKQNKIKELPAKTETFDDLCPAWTKSLDYFGDVRFWEEIYMRIFVEGSDGDRFCILSI